MLSPAWPENIRNEKVARRNGQLLTAWLGMADAAEPAEQNPGAAVTVVPVAAEAPSHDEDEKRLSFDDDDDITDETHSAAASGGSDGEMEDIGEEEAAEEEEAEEGEEGDHEGPNYGEKPRATKRKYSQEQGVAILVRDELARSGGARLQHLHAAVQPYYLGLLSAERRLYRGMLALNGTINCYLKYLHAVKVNGLWQLPKGHVPPTSEQVKQVKAEAVARLQARNLPMPAAETPQQVPIELAGTKHTKSIELCTLIRWSVSSREGATLEQITEDISPYYRGVVTGHKRFLFAPGADLQRYIIAYLNAMRAHQLADDKWVIPDDTPPAMEEVRKLRNRVQRRLAGGFLGQFQGDLEPDANGEEDSVEIKSEPKEALRPEIAPQEALRPDTEAEAIDLKTRFHEMAILVRSVIHRSQGGARYEDLALEISPYYLGLNSKWQGQRYSSYQTFYSTVMDYLRHLHAVKSSGKWTLPNDAPPMMEEVKRLRETALQRIASAGITDGINELPPGSANCSRDHELAMLIRAIVAETGGATYPQLLAVISRFFLGLTNRTLTSTDGALATLYTSHGAFYDALLGYLAAMGATKVEGRKWTIPNDTPVAPADVQRIQTEAITRILASEAADVGAAEDDFESEVSSDKEDNPRRRLKSDLQRPKYGPHQDVAILIRHEIAKHGAQWTADLCKAVQPYYLGMTSAMGRRYTGILAMRGTIGAYLKCLRARKREVDGKWVLPKDIPPTLEEVERVQQNALRVMGVTEPPKKSKLKQLRREDEEIKQARIAAMELADQNQQVIDDEPLNVLIRWALDLRSNGTTVDEILEHISPFVEGLSTKTGASMRLSGVARLITYYLRDNAEKTHKGHWVPRRKPPTQERVEQVQKEALRKIAEQSKAATAPIRLFPKQKAKEAQDQDAAQPIPAAASPASAPVASPSKRAPPVRIPKGPLPPSRHPNFRKPPPRRPKGVPYIRPGTTPTLAAAVPGAAPIASPNATASPAAAALPTAASPAVPAPSHDIAATPMDTTFTSLLPPPPSVSPPIAIPSSVVHLRRAVPSPAAAAVVVPSPVSAASAPLDTPRPYEEGFSSIHRPPPRQQIRKRQPAHDSDEDSYEFPKKYKKKERKEKERQAELTALAAANHEEQKGEKIFYGQSEFVFTEGVLPKKKAKAGRCDGCGTTSTPMWRRSPDGRKLLCNACGVRLFRVKTPKQTLVGSALGKRTVAPSLNFPVTGRTELYSLGVLVRWAIASRGGAATEEQIISDVDPYTEGLLTMHGSPFRAATVIRPIRSFLHKHRAIQEDGKWSMPDDVPPPLNQVRRVREEALKIIADLKSRPPAPAARAPDSDSDAISFDEVSNGSGNGEDSSMEQDAWASAERNTWPSLTPPLDAKKPRFEGADEVVPAAAAQPSTVPSTPAPASAAPTVEKIDAPVQPATDA